MLCRYIVEKRDCPDGKWVKANVGTLTDNKCTVGGLHENQPYEFRVCAVNDAGPGEYSSTSDEIYARPPPSAPKIDWDNFRLRDITVREGEPFRISIPFKGSPVPTVNWLLVRLLTVFYVLWTGFTVKFDDFESCSTEKNSTLRILRVFLLTKK